MKKLLNRLRSLFQSKPDPFYQEASRQIAEMEALILKRIEEAQIEAEMEDILHRSEWEEGILTAGRPVVLLPASRTLH